MSLGFRRIHERELCEQFLSHPLEIADDSPTTPRRCGSKPCTTKNASWRRTPGERFPAKIRAGVNKDWYTNDWDGQKLCWLSSNGNLDAGAEEATNAGHRCNGNEDDYDSFQGYLLLNA